MNKAAQEYKEAIGGQIPEKAADAGLRLAQRIFKTRGGHAEIHLSVNDLAVMLAAAYEIGKDEYIEGLSLDDLDEIKARFP